MSGHETDRGTGEPVATTAPFSAGVRVALRQYALEQGELRCRELGLGEIVVRPRLGERLEIRIRGERGLASSRIQELELVAPGRLAVVTRGRAYLLSRLDTRVGPDLPGGLQEDVARLLSRSPRPEDVTGEVTQYIRIHGPLESSGASPFVGVAVRIDRWPVGEPGAKAEAMGTGSLLEDPQPGLPLRFRDGEGHVLTSSLVTSVEQDGDTILEVGTENRRYRFERGGEPDGAENELD